MYKIFTLIVVLGLCNKFFPSAIRLLPAAEIDYKVVARLENSPLYFPSYLTKAHREMLACPKNKGSKSENCLGRIGFTYANKLFYVNGYSYVKTMMDYFDVLINFQKMGGDTNMLNREQRKTIFAFQNVSSSLIMCLKNEPCTSWLKSKGYATTAQIQQLNEQFRVLK